MVLAGVLLVLALRGSSGWGRRQPFDRDCVAILPFENRTGDPSLDYLGQRVVALLRQDLLPVDDLKVAADTPVPPRGDAFKRTAEAVRAHFVVGGAFYLRGGDLEFEARILDPWQGKVPYTFGPWRSARAEPDKALAELRQRVGGAIGWCITRQQFEAGAVRPPRLEAFFYFCKGAQRMTSDFRGAVADYDEALRLDPTFFHARVAKMDLLNDHEAYQESAQALALAEAQSRECTDVERQFLRMARADLDGRPWEVLKAFENFAATQPDSWWLRFNRAQYEIFVNRPESAVRDLTKNRPENFRHWGGAEWIGSLFLGTAMHMARDYRGQLRAARSAAVSFPDVLNSREDEACALIALGRLAELEGVFRDAATVAQRPETMTADYVQFHAVLELRAHGHQEESRLLAARVLAGLQSLPPEARKGNHFTMAQLLICLGRESEALELLRHLSAEDPENVGLQGRVGALLARLGRKDEARKAEADLAALARPYLFGEHTFWRACIVAQLGEKDRAVDLLGRAFGQGRRFWVDIHREPLLEPLHGFPPYEELMKPKG